MSSSDGEASRVAPRAMTESERAQAERICVHMQSVFDRAQARGVPATLTFAALAIFISRLSSGQATPALTVADEFHRLVRANLERGTS